MFRSDWRTAAAYILIALLCFGGLQYGVYKHLSLIAKQNAAYEKGTQAHIDYAEDAIDRECLSLEGVALRDCIHDNIATARDHDRANQDLDAQQNMAKFTRIMGYTAVIGLALGAVSIVAIFMTLKATQDMANDARLIGADEIKFAKEANSVARQAIREGSRPFVYVEPLESNFHIWKEGGAQFSWPFRIENLGGSAAIVESIKVSTRISSTLGENVEWFDHDLMKANGMAPGRTEELVLMPNAQHQPSRGGFLFMLKGENQTDIMNNESFVFMKVFVIYEDMYGDPHETEATFQHAFHTYKVTTAGGKEHNRRT